MHEFIRKNTWAVFLVGVVLLVVGESQTAGQAADGTGKQMFFDTVTIVGFILALSGFVLLVRKRKAKK